MFNEEEWSVKQGARGKATLKWLKACKNPEEVRDRIIVQQFLHVQPEDIKVFIQERKPAASEEVGRLADNFL